MTLPPKTGESKETTTKAAALVPPSRELCAAYRGKPCDCNDTIAARKAGAGSSQVEAGRHLNGKQKRNWRTHDDRTDVVIIYPRAISNNPEDRWEPEPGKIFAAPPSAKSGTHQSRADRMIH